MPKISVQPTATRLELIISRCLHHSSSRTITKARPVTPQTLPAFQRTSQFSTMSDDASYSAFLNTANANPDPIPKSATVSHSTSEQVQSTSETRSKHDPTRRNSDAIPGPLKDISTTYTSDTDSNFEPVFFSYASDELPDAKTFTKVLGRHGEKVEELSVEDWDPRGQYGDVVRSVEDAGEGDGKGSKRKGVKVFRVEIDATRVEYYVVTVGDRKILGVVAKAVES